MSAGVSIPERDLNDRAQSKANLGDENSRRLNSAARWRVRITRNDRGRRPHRCAFGVEVPRGIRWHYAARLFANTIKARKRIQAAHKTPKKYIGQAGAPWPFPTGASAFFAFE